LPEGQALLLRTATRVSRGETVPVWVPRDRVLIFADRDNQQPVAHSNPTDGPPAEVAAGPSAGVATPTARHGAEAFDATSREHEVTPS
jgi:hypothetical protein